MHYGGAATEAFCKTHEHSFMFAKLCDLFIGLPFAFLYATKDEKLRRKYYGRAGECRIQKYPNDQMGVEYRVPSPKLWNDHCVATLFFGVMRTIVGNYTELARTYKPEWEKAIQDAINNCEVPMEMLQTVPGLYTPELLIELKKRRHFRKFVFPSSAIDCHTAFSEHVYNHWSRPEGSKLMATRGVYDATPYGVIKISPKLF